MAPRSRRPKGKPPTPQAILERLQQGLNKFTQPLQANAIKHKRNKRAEAHQRRIDNKPLTREFVDPITNRVGSKSGGLEAYTYQSPEVNSRSKTRTAHELGFKRDTADPYEAYTARTDSRPEVAATRRAAIKSHIGRLLNQVEVGDRLYADSYDGDGKDVQRSKMYQRATKGALTADEFGYQSASRMRNNNWVSSTNQNGKGSRNIKHWDPSRLGDDLKNLAKGKILKLLFQHPAAQAAINADEIIGGVTGTRPSEKVGQEFRNATEKAILERLKKGQRFGSPVGPMPF